MDTATAPEIDPACARSRWHVINALGLAKRAQADLETVRVTTENRSKTNKAITRALGKINDVVARLEAAEHNLRKFFDAGGVDKAIKLLSATGDSVREASQAVREEALVRGSSEVPWLMEADGALSVQLVTAVDAAAMSVRRLERQEQGRPSASV